jgi:rubrerythrin
LSVAGREIEALECWRRTLNVQPNFVMALCNRAKIFADYAKSVEDNDQKALFLWMAHKEASAALAPTAIYTDARDEVNRGKSETLKEWIESVMDVKGIAALKSAHTEGHC